MGAIEEIDNGVGNSQDHAKEMLLRNTMDVLRAFMECSDEIQQGVLEMAHIVADSKTSADEKSAAEDTLIEALYPKYHGEQLGIDSASYDEIQRSTDPDVEKSLDLEEADFAKNLERLMAEKGFTQSRLADAIGVGQPAISMMLTRSCRPQRRTVQKVAEALGVSVESLWPTTGTPPEKTAIAAG